MSSKIYKKKSKEKHDKYQPCNRTFQSPKITNSIKSKEMYICVHRDE